MILLLIPLMMVRGTPSWSVLIIEAMWRMLLSEYQRPTVGCGRPAGGDSGDRALYRAGRGEREVQYKRSYLYFGCRSRYWSKAIKTLKRENRYLSGQVWHTDMAIKASLMWPVCMS